MGKKAQYQSISAFWTLFMPLVVGGVLYFSYHSGGWVGAQVQGMLNPILDLASRVVQAVF